MEHLGVTILEIPIKDVLDPHLKGLSHDDLDVTYENAQARIRTLYLMNLANKYKGFVLGYRRFIRNRTRLYDIQW